MVQCFTASGTLFCLKVAQAPAGFTFSTYSLFRVYSIIGFVGFTVCIEKKLLAFPRAAGYAAFSVCGLI